MGRAPAVALWVDPTVHAAEVARFRSKIVAGPGDGDCSICRYITRDGIGRCVRPNRYALALATGVALTPSRAATCSIRTNSDAGSSPTMIASRR